MNSARPPHPNRLNLAQRVAVTVFVAAAAGLLAAAAVAAPTSVAATPAAAQPHTATCPPPPPASTPFTSFGDSSSYVLVNDGTFEPLAKNSLDSPWTLSGPASLIHDNEPWHIAGQGDTAASLGSGSIATSACTTAPMIKSIVRFFVKNTGSPTGRLEVEILVNGGRNGILNGGTITARSTWALSPQINVPWPNPLNGAVQLQVNLIPVGTGASFEVDDVYLDPFCSH